MSTEEKATLSSGTGIRYLVGGGLVLLIAVGVVIALTSGRNPSTRKETRPLPQPHESLNIVRETLAPRPDLTSCKIVVQQMNDYLGRTESRPPQLSEAQLAYLNTHFHLEGDELAQLTGNSFTLLDAHHLDLCFLLRDALRSLLGQDEPGKAAKSPEQAAAAFAWVVRQVALLERPGEPLPPQFVLRRGWGTALERALIFQAMLQQLEIPGCLVALPEEGSTGRAALPGERGSHLWVCGAVVEQDGGKHLLLFDPYLGLALPGPGGAGIATLAQVQAEPELLTQLTVDNTHPYDVTPEQVGRIEIYLVCSLSALSPRMRYLEQKLHDPHPSIKAPAIPVSLAAGPDLPEADAADMFGQFKSVVGPGPTLKVAARLARVQRRFLPAEEGGSDPEGRLARFHSELVPWQLLPRQIQELPGEPGRRLHNIFGQPFLQLLLEPRKARDLVLRGQFTDAILDLVSALDELREQRTRGQRIPADWQLQLERWREKANAAHAGLLRAERKADAREPASEAAVASARAQVSQVWQEGHKLLAPLIQERAAGPRSLQLTYLLALRKLEQAEQLQVRLSRSAGSDRKAAIDQEAARSAGQDAAQCWESFANEHGETRLAAAARRLHARARMMLGERERAAILLEDRSGALTDLEKTAHLYLAQQLRAAPK